MKCWRSKALFIIAFLCGGSLQLLGQSFEKMDDTWTVMVNGQSVRVETDGSFTIPNVSAPDQFGAGGPGTAPDFVSDDFLRVIGVSTAGGTTRYAYSTEFQFKRGQQFSLGTMTISNTPPPFPQSIRILSPGAVLQVGQSAQLQVFGRLIDNSELDVTTTGTTYRTSNLAIASVDPTGRVMASSPGFVVITALNEGATATSRIGITSAEDPLTTVVGLLQFADGTPVSGAEVLVSGQGLTGVSGQAGTFQIQEVATELGLITVVATLGNFGGTSEPTMPLPGMITDVGTIVLEELACLELDPGTGIQLFTGGPGTGRSIYLSANETFSITGLGWRTDMVAMNYIVEVYEGLGVLSSTGPLLASLAGTAGGIGLDWNELPLPFTFQQGSDYIINWRPENININWLNNPQPFFNWGDSLADDVDLGLVVIRDGREGFNANSFGNFVAPHFRLAFGVGCPAAQLPLVPVVHTINTSSATVGN